MDWPRADDPYLVERVRAHLAEDERCGVLGLVVRVASGRLFISGPVPSERCRESIAIVAAEVAGSIMVVNEAFVTSVSEPMTEGEFLQ